MNPRESQTITERDEDDYDFINPSVLNHIKNSHLWSEDVYPGWPEHKIDTFLLDVDCRNLNFHRDFEKNDFYLDVGFLSVVLKIVCRDIEVIKMNIDVRERSTNDFYITSGEYTVFYLRSNGIEVWCDSIEFLGTENQVIEPINKDYDGDEFPF